MAADTQATLHALDWNEAVRRALATLATGQWSDSSVAFTPGTVTADTELPAAQALTADGIAAPTSPIVGVFPYTMDRAATWSRLFDPGNSVDASEAKGALTSGLMQYSGSGNNWDRKRGNVDNITCGITAAGVTTTQTGADQTNYNHRGLQVVLDMTTVGTGSVTLAIDAKDPVSGKYYNLLTGAAVVTNSTNVYKVYPGLPVAANVSANDVLPRTWRIKVTANNANATTYTVGAMLIL